MACMEDTAQPQLVFIFIPWPLTSFFKLFHLGPLNSLSLISKKFEIDFGNLSRDVFLCQDLPKIISIFLELWFGGAIHFCVYKGIVQKYKGNFASGPFLLSFELGCPN